MITRLFIFRFFAGLQGLFIAAMLLFLLMVAVGWSGFFIAPQSIAVSSAGTVFVRATPFGAVDAVWTMEVTARGGLECPAASGAAIIQVAPGDTVRLPLPEAVAPCVEPGAVVDLSYQVRLFGLPLRPVRITTIVEN